MCVANFVFEPLHPALVARVPGRRFTAGKQAGWAECCGEGGTLSEAFFLRVERVALYEKSAIPSELCVKYV